VIVGGIAVVFSDFLINDGGLCACLEVYVDCREYCVRDV